MANVVNLNRYKQAKVLVRDLSKILEEYNYVLSAINTIQHNMAKWQQYQSPLLAAYKLEEFKMYLQYQIVKVKTTITYEQGVIDEFKRNA